MNNIENPPKKRGCFFYGCITSLVLLVIVLVVGFLGVRFALHKIDAMVAQYTDTQAMVMPKEEMPAAELEKLKARFAAFQVALDAHSNAVPLILTGPEINALLRSSPNMKAMHDSFYVAVEGDQIKGQLSLPLSQIKFPLVDLNGRYLNGAAVFKAVLTNDQLWVTIQQLEVKGKPVPEQFMTQFRNKNLAEDAQNNPTNSAAIRNFESIEIKDGKVIITPKPAQ
ncbi:MAG: hypothetical protein JWR19_4616 [Pedosphaera sp.]|jgi:hypothetical protein|nr:hypothetical protein [Pedosphaera sp.]